MSSSSASTLEFELLLFFDLFSAASDARAASAASSSCWRFQASSMWARRSMEMALHAIFRRSSRLLFFGVDDDDESGKATPRVGKRERRGTAFLALASALLPHGDEAAANMVSDRKNSR